MKQLLNDFRELLAPILLSGFGGVARVLDGYRRGEPIGLCRAVAELVLAVFAGLLMHWLTKDASLSDGVRTAAISLAGYSSRPIIDIINNIFLKKLKGIEK